MELFQHQHLRRQSTDVLGAVHNSIAPPLGLAQLSPSRPISHLPTCPALFSSPELLIMHQLSRYVMFLLPLS